MILYDSVASTDGISIIMVRASSMVSFENRNLSIHDFNHLKKQEEIHFKTTLTNRKPHKYMLFIREFYFFCIMMRKINFFIEYLIAL